MPINKPTMEDPAVYKICIKGELVIEWSNRLAGMQITTTADGYTTLVGRLSDQAALAGVLSTLYELHMPVSSVECLDAD